MELDFNFLAHNLDFGTVCNLIKPSVNGMPMSIPIIKSQHGIHLDRHY